MTAMMIGFIALGGMVYRVAFYRPGLAVFRFFR